MRHMLGGVVTAGLLFIALAAPLAAQPVEDRGPCGQVVAACKDAGFRRGGVRTGTGLIADCVVPIVQGTPQPRRARIRLPQVDPQVVDECKASNPPFARKGAPPSEPAPAAGEPPPPPSVAAQPPTPATAASACAASDDLRPHGLAVVLPSEERRDRSSDLRALGNPSISGLALQINWRDLEPAAGRPDWSTLDDLFAAAESSNKWVQLLIFPGFFSPAWALEGVDTDEFPIPYGPGHGTPTALPMPWDRVYLGRWLAKRVSERYGGSPAFRVMAASGPTSVSAEMTLPVGRMAVTKFLAHGYTPQRYLAAWDRIFQAYAEYFPNQCISLSAANVPILENGRVIDRAGHMRARLAIIEKASRIFGRRFVIQWSDLHTGRARVEAPDQTGLVISYSGRIITGLQMRSSAMRGSAVMGAEGDPPLALRKSIDKGMQPNSARRHVDYLEIYKPDVLADQMQPVLRYGASLFARQ